MPKIIENLIWSDNSLESGGEHLNATKVMTIFLVELFSKNASIASQKFWSRILIKI